MDFLARIGIVIDICAWLVAIPLAAGALMSYANGGDWALQVVLVGLAVMALLTGRTARFILSGN